MSWRRLRVLPLLLPYAGSPQCGEGDAAHIVVGQPLIYDTRDKSKASSVLDWVYQVWPATGYAISGVWPDSYTGRR